jgi:hypothetical protein
LKPIQSQWAATSLSFVLFGGLRSYLVYRLLRMVRNVPNLEESSFAKNTVKISCEFFFYSIFHKKLTSLIISSKWRIILYLECLVEKCSSISKSAKELSGKQFPDNDLLAALMSMKKHRYALHYASYSLFQYRLWASETKSGDLLYSTSKFWIFWTWTWQDGHFVVWKIFILEPEPAVIFAYSR